MTDMNTDETPENRTDIETRLAQIEEAIRELRDVLERQNQASTTEAPIESRVTPGPDRLEGAKATAWDVFNKAKDRAGGAARGAGLPLWAVVVIGVLAVIGVADLVDLDLHKVLHL